MVTTILGIGFIYFGITKSYFAFGKEDYLPCIALRYIPRTAYTECTEHMSKLLDWKMEASTMTENPVSYSHNSPESTSSEPDGSDSQEPLKKKMRSESYRKAEGEKLEERLNGILCCTVCLDLPVCTVYQCTNGHLMCAGCFTHLLADARLKEGRATCPNCRCEISKNLCSRNLAVEKAVSELPMECPHCNQQLPRSAVDQHVWNQCQESTAGSFFSCRRLLTHESVYAT